MTTDIDLNLCISHIACHLASCLTTDRPCDKWHASQVQSGMSGSPVAVRAGACLLGRWLLPRVRQHSALSAVSWRSYLCGATNTQQLRQQTFCSRWTSLVELSSGPAVQSRHHRRWQLKGHLSQEAWMRHSVTSDMRHFRKTLTYSLTYLAMELHSYSMAEKKVKVVSYW